MTRTLYHTATDIMDDWPIEERPSVATAALRDIMQSCAPISRAGMIGKVARGGVPLRSVIQVVLNQMGSYRTKKASALKAELRRCV